MGAFTPTEEQNAIVQAARGQQSSLMVTAYAGCAKTTTLELMAQVLPPIPSLALAFNVKIKKELERRFPKHFTVKTMNGLGHGAWIAAIGQGLELDEKKLGKLVTKELKTARRDSDPDAWQAVRELVSAAMQAGLVPKEFPHKGLVPDTTESWQDIADSLFSSPSAEYFDLAQKVLTESIKLGYDGVISFDDQIYLPTLFGGRFKRYDIVLVDEGQDLSPLNHLMVEKSLTPMGRLFVCGDPKQAIYAFRGADSQSMGKLRAIRKDWIDLPLAMTFRCPKIIVDRQSKHAPGFRAAESNAAGQFVQWHKQGGEGQADGAKIAWLGEKHDGWTYHWLQKLTPDGGKIAILCRNNAPLLSLAFKLIRAGIPPVMLGRDIGQGLIALSKKLCKDDNMSVEDCLHSINEWKDRECSLARANGEKGKIAGITDRAECLIAVAESAAGVKDAKGLRKAIEDLFSREAGRVTLATGHKAKGLEWETVVHLDPWRIPSRYALEDPSQMEQERNLHYVIETRARQTLVEASLQDFIA